MISRRAIFGGLAGLLAAPAIVKAASLMPVKPLSAATYRTSYYFGPHCSAPSRDLSDVIEILNRNNEILASMTWVEAGPKHVGRSVVRTGLPSAYWRLVGR